MVAHSHNDYKHERPLFSALKQQFYSVEADLWVSGNRLVVTHDFPFSIKGDLVNLYLEPLQKLVDKRGSVYGDGRPFYLWLDIKDWDRQAISILKDILTGVRDFPLSSLPDLFEQDDESRADFFERTSRIGYSMLTSFTDSNVTNGPVTIIITGNDEQKKRFINDEFSSIRYAARDSNFYHSHDPVNVDHRWSWYALNWKKYFKWNGRGAISAVERAAFFAMVRDIHHKGRKVRFWKAPETEAFFRLMCEAGVDFINADNLRFLADFMRHNRCAQARQNRGLLLN